MTALEPVGEQATLRHAALADDLGLDPTEDVPPLETAATTAYVDKLVYAVAKRRQRVAQAEVECEGMVAPYLLWLERVRRDNDTAWLEGQLQAYHEARLRDEPKAKTLDLPHGKLVARKAVDEWAPIDPDALLRWAEEVRPDITRTKVTVDKPAMKKALLPVDRDLAAFSRLLALVVPVRVLPLDVGDVVDPVSGDWVPGLWFGVGAVGFSVVTPEAKP